MYLIKFSKTAQLSYFYAFDNVKLMYIIHVMVVISTAGGTMNKSAREGNDGRVK